MGNCFGQPHQHENPLQDKPKPKPVANLLELPAELVSAILSHTTPRDVCRLAVVSKLFKSIAYSDSLWIKFLPQQYEEILARAVTPVNYTTKRELYFCFCNSICIDRTKLFWLERSTAKISYMLSSRELFIAWGQDERYWDWVSRNDSRFKEAARLLKVCWLEIRGKIDKWHLSLHTNYRVVFVFKFTEGSYGWNDKPIKFSIKTPEIKSKQVWVREERVADDGWIKVVAGDFTVSAAEDIDNEPSHYVEFSMEEVELLYWKRGLLLDGVRIEPMSI